MKYIDKPELENYQVEDFISDESFINYHFQSNQDDYLFWNAWIQKNLFKQALVKEAKEMIDGLSFNLTEKEYGQELQKITFEINKRNKKHDVLRYPRNNQVPLLSKKKKRILMYIFPLVAILAIGGSWLMWSFSNSSQKLLESVNKTKEPLVLSLSDGSIVTLTPGSYLQYPGNFKNKDRDVYLQGNAQFSVRRNGQHPFKVHTENIVATVLGTIFNIKSSGDSAIVVELLTGKLQVQIMNDKMESGQSVLLVANESAVYVRTGNHLYKNLLVKERNVLFSQNNFEEIASQIKNVFGATVINQSKNKAWNFTGEFKNSTAIDIIGNICTVKNLSFVSKGDTIFIR
ncbi:MAG: FecR family protein [Ginsengibacter sp.]